MSSQDNDLIQSASSVRQSRRTEPRYEFVIDDTEEAASFDVNDEHSEHPKLGSRRHKPSAKREARALAAIAAVIAVVAILVVGYLLSANLSDDTANATPAAPTGNNLGDTFLIQHNWGTYSPYFDTGIPFEGVSQHALDGEYTLPDQCAYNQIHVLHRHGDRFPAEGTVQKIARVVKKLEDLNPDEINIPWLANWNFTLKSDLLNNKGVATLFSSGSRFWQTHGRLLYGKPGQISFGSSSLDVDALAQFANETNVEARLPIIRATTQARIADSARAWAAGFFGNYVSDHDGWDAGKTWENPQSKYELLLMSESANSNNSLAPYFGCPKEHDARMGKNFTDQWDAVYLKDAAARIQELIPGYKNFGTDDALVFQDLCAFETAAYGSSAFCELFTKLEWRGYEYHSDLKFYGESGWGSAAGAAMGIPYLAELRARLKKELLVDAAKYGANSTLDSSLETFPLDQQLYADFTHDSIIFSVLSALQFPWMKQTLPTTSIKAPRQLIMSRLAPFGARLYFEIMKCGADEEETFVRARLNERILPLQDLQHCPSDPMGLCPLKDFIKTLDWAIDQIDFVETCY